MKLCLWLSLLLAFQCRACESSDIEAFRKDVERAFVTKSFADIATKYGETKHVALMLEDEYDEDHPTRTLKFDSIGRLSKWFFDKHQYSENMIVPAPVVCRSEGCRYELPELTLHHGIYLLGFERVKAGRCTPLAKVEIHWG